ncbi:hypothetical protein AK830_g6032 [Neonectria ditissima]|uniref:Uncharacterized protein n=1 Tax=Neonectria ditissima TaxID=78410 RepID=A0A0P7BJH2_9HYPO|nr:hypothetical protein AK830_g6032 [Neonectria ditissima]
MGANYGFLIPDSYVREVPSKANMNISSIFWGFSLGAALFSAGTAAQHSLVLWRRYRRVSGYVLMLWAVWASGTTMGILVWLFQRQWMNPSFGFYFTIVLLWAIQVQFLLQIIIDRLSLLLDAPGHATKLKWLVFAVLFALNISVFVVWMPAHLQVSEKWIHLNKIWDRCEKVIFAIIDAAVNGYFLYIVRARLSTHGLTKYLPLYHMNLGLVFASLSFDIALIGLASLKSNLVYMSFHPICYLFKLQIEMQMAELVTKIVRASNNHGNASHRLSTGGKSRNDDVSGKPKFSHSLSKGHSSTFRGGNTTQIEVGDRDSDLDDGGNGVHSRAGEHGILKTVQTTIDRVPAVDNDRDDVESRSSSTRNLHFRGGYEQ